MKTKKTKENSFMKKWKQLIAAVLTLAMLVTLMPAESVKAAGTEPAKLSAEDFVFISDEKNYDFWENSKDDETYFAWVYKKTDTKGGNSTDTTNRKVKLGSTEAFVKKQYGNATKVKVNKKDRIYKYLKYGYPEVDVSIWKNYLEYTYKSGKDTYKIRFYLGKKNKVAAIVYIKNLKKIYNYPNKEINPGLTFLAPNGEKIATQKINGKTVYMVPRGTKIEVTEYLYTFTGIYRHDVYGNIINRPGIQDHIEVAPGQSYDLETVINGNLSSWGMEEEYMLDFDNLGEYLFFEIYVDGEQDWPSETYTTAPKHYYFKFI